MNTKLKDRLVFLYQRLKKKNVIIQHSKIYVFYVSLLKEFRLFYIDLHRHIIRYILVLQIDVHIYLLYCIYILFQKKKIKKRLKKKLFIFNQMN